MKDQPAAKSEEAKRFVDFARKLVSVPKAEIDQKQAEYHKKRIAERKATRKPLKITKAE